MSERKIDRRANLIVVSNRLPYNLPAEPTGQPPTRNVGGLVNALEPVLAAGNGSWIGWDGVAAPSLPEGDATRTFRTDTGVDLIGVPLTESEIEEFYHGLSNRTLWPLFHSILDKSVFESEDWSAYERVNRRFAQTAVTRGTSGDRIWVHDYHLMQMPSFVREMGFRGRIDFFLHIPFPPPEIFLSLPWRKELIQGMLACDSVAFHVKSYRDNFLRSAAAITGAPLSTFRRGAEVTLRHPGGTCVATVSPIGVDVDDFERIAGLESVAIQTETIRRAHDYRHILFSADRLDYTKGINERMLAVERFLTNHPERAGSFVLFQVVVPSRGEVDEYISLKAEIDQNVGRINGSFGRDGWNPIHYEYRALDREELVAHYRTARIALVTPLRDGMNLVAPEFVAARTDNDGVLLLSEFAGVSEQLREAVRVNPYDLEGCAEAIGLALDMPPAERVSRMKRLRKTVRGNSLDQWVTRCLTAGTHQDGKWPGLTGGLRGGATAEPKSGKSRKKFLIR